MKYEVSHSVLSHPTGLFLQGQTVTAEELTGAGFDVDFLLRNRAIEPLKGTEDGGTAPATDRRTVVPTTTFDAHPSQGQPPASPNPDRVGAPPPGTVVPTAEPAQRTLRRGPTGDTAAAAAPVQRDAPPDDGKAKK